MTAASKAELQSLLRRQQITPTKMSEKGKEFNLPTLAEAFPPRNSRCSHGSSP